MSNEFSDGIKNKVLLWSDRHCCLCKKACGIDIQVHHIVSKEEGGTSKIDNAIPLCYDCHAKVHYRSIQGNSLKPAELVRRRDQIYEEFTHHLIHPINILITQRGGRIFPDVGFEIKHAGSTYPIRVLVNIYSIIGGKEIRFNNGENKYYSGKHEWNLNPQKGFNGHFTLPNYMMPENYLQISDIEKDKYRLELRVKLDIIDILDRKHEFLPEGFIYTPTLSSEHKWYAEP